jgi:N utilization substance protein A
LAPARVVQVRTQPDAKEMTVIVDDDKLSLAIGRNGQNARLAAKLTGYKITIRSESQYLAQRSRALDTTTSLEQLPGIGEVTKGRLEANGIDSIETLATKTPEDLISIEGIGPKTAAKLVESAQDFVAQQVGYTISVARPVRRPSRGDELFDDTLGEDPPEDEDVDEAVDGADGAPPRAR